MCHPPPPPCAFLGVPLLIDGRRIHGHAGGGEDAGAAGGARGTPRAHHAGGMGVGGVGGVGGVVGGVGWGRVGGPLLDCYWVGSLDFNFLDSPHISF